MLVADFIFLSLCVGFSCGRLDSSRMSGEYGRIISSASMPRVRERIRRNSRVIFSMVLRPLVDLAAGLMVSARPRGDGLRALESWLTLEATVEAVVEALPVEDRFDDSSVLKLMGESAAIPEEQARRL